MNQTKKPIDIVKVVEATGVQIQRWVGTSASARVPIVVVGGHGPNGPVAMLGQRLNKLLHMPDIRNIHTPDELVEQLEKEKGSHVPPMMVHCGEQIYPRTQKELVDLYGRHRNSSPRLLIVVIGISPEELVRGGRWQPGFCELFAARIVDYERLLASERRRSLDLFRGHLQRKAQKERAEVQIDADALELFGEVVRATHFVGNDTVMSIAENAYARACALTTHRHKVRVTREHLLEAMPGHLIKAIGPAPGQMLN